MSLTLECAMRSTERGLDRVFGSGSNPMRQLGALGFWLFWIVVASGAYVYAFFDTSVTGVYASIAGWSHEPWNPAGLMRSFHRYASDSFVAVMVVHLARELAYGRYRGFRWFSWTSGVPLIGLIVASGIIGYWLVWDQLAQFVAIAASEWLGWLPGFGDTLVRNFLAVDSLSDRFFSLLTFAHIGVSLFLLLGMWVHIQRIAAARCQPSRGPAWAMLAMLLVLPIARPALSQSPADLAYVPMAPSLDWLFLFPFPIVYRLSPGLTWALTAATMLLLCLLPWLRREPRAPAAVVDPAWCNGCGRCATDCPYSSVMIVSSGRGKQARVLEDLCAGCGICVGSCPVSIPLRGAFRTGIDLPQLPIASQWARLEQALAFSPGSMVVFGCDHGTNVASLPGVTAISFPCIGMLPPSFVKHAIRHGAVLVAHCAEGACEFRFDGRWTDRNIESDRLRVVRTGVGEEGALARAVEAFRAHLGRQDAKPVLPRDEKREPVYA